MNDSNLAALIEARCKGRFKAGESLASHTSIKIGGPAECWFEPEDAASLNSAIRLAQEEKTPITVIGGGSNLLLPDEGLKGLVIHLSSPAFRQMRMEGECVVAGGAVGLQSLLQFLIANGRGECEFLMGIPAQVGGALMMNAGSASQWIGSYLVDLEGIGFDGQNRRFSREDIPFHYRSSGLENLIITRAVLRFPPVPPSVTKEHLSVYSDYRRKTQDLKYPSAGCMFRNPGDRDASAGLLIEEAGLKGLRAGRAQISNLHANFAVNLGGAKQGDVLELLRLAEEAVTDRFGVKLIREIKVIHAGRAAGPS